MKILGIESAAMTASAAVLEDDLLVAEYTIDYRKTHSQTLLPMIAEIRDMVQLDMETLDAIAVSGGPGSFTGLRIGSTTAKGLGLALGKKLIHVPTLDAMAYQIFGVSGPICAMMDARKENVFAGIYRNEQELEIIKPSCHISVQELAQELNQLGEPVVLVGDGADAYRQQLEKFCRVPLRRAPAFSCRARAGAVAALGMEYYKKGRTETAAAHVPNYLRVSQAERQMAEVQKHGAEI